MKNKINENNLQTSYGLALEQYSNLEGKRRILEKTWEKCSKLTLPYVFPKIGTIETTDLPTPYNSIGASAVNVLSSKLLLTLLPFTNTFFRLLPYEEDIKDNSDELNLQIDKELTSVERQVVSLIDTEGLRVPLYEALKYLIITGNVLIYKIPNGTFKVFTPKQYVVERDYAGNNLRIIIKEEISLSVLPDEIKNMYNENNKEKQKNEVDIYTVIVRTDTDKYISYQETMDTIIPNTLQKYNKEFLPYITLRWTTVPNEDYGRGLVEQYLGDLISLEGLSKSIVEGSELMSNVIFGLNPGSMTSIEDINNASNGDVISGNFDKDITVMEVNKNSDFSIPLKLMEQLEARLSKAFLLVSGQIRNSERTTATEVRATTAELEATLGGTFSVLASDLQIPLINLLLKEINPKFTKITQPTIITGVSAISREKDYNNLNTMLQTVAQLGPEAISTYLNIPGYLTSVANSLGMNADDMINSPEEITAKQQAQAAAQQAQGQLPQGIDPNQQQPQ